MSTPAHTPTPWKVIKGGVIIYAQRNPGGRKTYLADVSQDPGINQSIANAAFIVRACNSHAALVAALERLLTAFIEARALAIKEPMACTPLVTSIQCAGGAVAEARAALAAAKEQS